MGSTYYFLRFNWGDCLMLINWRCTKLPFTYLKRGLCSKVVWYLTDFPWAVFVYYFCLRDLLINLTDKRYSRITGLISGRALIELGVWHLDVGSKHSASAIGRSLGELILGLLTRAGFRTM